MPSTCQSLKEHWFRAVICRDILELSWPAQIKAAKPQVFPDQQQGFGGGRGGGFGGGRGSGGQRGLRSPPHAFLPA